MSQPSAVAPALPKRGSREKRRLRKRRRSARSTDWTADARVRGKHLPAVPSRRSRRVCWGAGQLRRVNEEPALGNLPGILHLRAFMQMEVLRAYS